MIWNSKDTMLDEMLRGLVAAQPGEFERIENLYSYSLAKRNLTGGRVRIITNGGGGTGPMFPGFVGNGLADGMCSGELDCAPNAYAIYELAKHIEDGRGVILIVNHFAGDFLNNDMAQELLATENIDSRAVYVSDDMFSCKGEPKENRGGLNGILHIIRIAAAAAEKGLDLDEVYRIAEKANARLRSITVCVNEDEGTVEFGNGFSGEAPSVTSKYECADQLAGICAEYLTEELSEYGLQDIVLSVNRHAYTTYNEGYVMLNAMIGALQDRSHIVSAAAGSYFPIFKRNGFIISVLALDDELKDFVHPVSGYDFSI